MRRHYDFSNGIRETCAKRSLTGTNVVLLDADVLHALPIAEALNRALRSLLATRTRRRR